MLSLAPGSRSWPDCSKEDFEPVRSGQNHFIVAERTLMSPIRTSISLIERFAARLTGPDNRQKLF